MPLDKSWTNVILIVRWKDSVIVIEINRCPSVFLCDERRHRGGIQSQIDGWKHDSSRHPLSDKETQPRSWTLTKQASSAHAKYYNASPAASQICSLLRSSEVDQAPLVSPSCSLSLFAALSQLTSHT